jgi:hypothetical protein
MQNRIVSVCGRKGSGKSTALREIVSCRSRVAVFDMLAEHRFGDVFWDAEEAAVRIRSSRIAPSFAVTLRPLEGQEEESLDILADACWDTGNLCLAVEEVPWLSTAVSQPRGLDLVARMGRHRRIDLVWTAQRLAEVSRRLTSATDVFVLFRTNEPRDLAALGERCGQAVAEEVSRLEAHAKLVFDVAKGTSVCF